MNFHYPAALWLLVPYAMLVGLFTWSRWQRRRDLMRLGDWRLVRQLVPLDALRRRRFKARLALSALFLVIVSAAGPQFGNKMTEVRHEGVDVFIAMDTSRSMLAEDVGGSRLEKAKRSLGLLIDKLAGNRIGIIAFAKRAVIQCPLTVDSDAAKMFLDILDENSVPEQGTSLGDAIRLGLSSFPKDDKAGRAIVLLTDGEDHSSDPEGAAHQAKEAGVVLFTIGIGTTKGEVIKDRDEQGNVVSFHKYNGEMVVSRLDDALLTKLAEITGGKYYRASSTDQEIDEIADVLNGFDKREFSTKLFERRQERFQIFVAIALLLLLLEFFWAERRGQAERVRAGLADTARSWRFRRRTAATTAAVLVLAATAARADVRDHIRRGDRLVAKHDLDGARKEFESAEIDAPDVPFIPYNIGMTYYLEGNFDEAKKRFEQALSESKDPRFRAQVNYNLGHLLFDMGQSDAAIEQFKECLRLNPGDMDAKYNIEYIRAGNKPKGKPSGTPKSSNDKQKNGPSPSPQPGSKGEGQEPQPTTQPKPGELSKDEADQILRMSQEQESEKMKGAAIPKSGESQKRKDEGGEDW